MELDNLKQLWRKIEMKPAPEEPERILALLGKRSRGPLAKMRQNLFGELVLVFATYTPAILYYFFGFGGKLSVIAWLLILMLILFSGYCYRKDRLLRKMLCVTCRVRSSLQLQLLSLQKYVRIYTLLGTIMVPVMAIFSLAVILYEFPAYPPGWLSLLPWAIALVPVTIGSFYLNSWYVRKLYGRHIRKLKELLQEMDD